MTETRHVIAALVQNEPGVLSRVAGMFAARGFNIDSLVVGRTENPAISRMTIVVLGDDAVLEQVRKQLGKVVEVVKIVDFHNVAFVERDLMLMRVASTGQSRRDIIELAGLFGAQVVDVGHAELTIELSGEEDHLEAFVDLVSPYGIVEMARTGVIAMPRSEKAPGKAPAARSLAVRPDTDPSGGSGVEAGDLPPG